MNYSESKQILEEIKKAKRILIACHVNPDPDGVGGALALAGVIHSLGKEVLVISSVEIEDSLSFLAPVAEIRVIDPAEFVFTDYDLFIALDASQLSRSVVLPVGKDYPKKIINIDHHQKNEMFGRINLVNTKAVSVCEILYLLFQDWEIKIDRETATALLTGIIGDSGAFRFPTATAKTLRIACKLMEKGADKNKIISNLFFSYDLEYYRFWAEVIKMMVIDSDHGFVWSAVPYDVFVKCGAKRDFKEVTATELFEAVKGTDFGLLMVEQRKGEINISFRSRTGLDTSAIARKLGGGGHVYASGAKIKAKSFESGVNKVLEVCRKYAKKTG